MKRLLICCASSLMFVGLMLGVVLIASRVMPLQVIGVATIVCAYAMPFARLWIRK